ncbi:MAG: hypothetical protein U9R49_07055 [Bacteroidota bacterium]|nr:hypothetical protein [Bacteroidota bacterium]
MKSRSRLWFKQIGTGLMILVMGIFLFNKAVYTHVHILPDGTLVSHAHPISNSADSNRNTSHQHSSLELFLLDMLELIILSVLAVFILKPIAPSDISGEATKDRLLPALVPVLPGRAPPACM